MSTLGRKQIRDMLAYARDLPADGIARLAPGHAMRVVHIAGSPFCAEEVLVEYEPGTAYQSARKGGCWSRPRPVGFTEWGKVEFKR
jgi:hypothetical protein